MTALIFALIKENYVSEQGARMVSMDGASKNAGDMIDKLTLSFNRMRQAVSITRPECPESACSRTGPWLGTDFGPTKNHKILPRVFIKSGFDLSSFRGTGFMRVSVVAMRNEYGFSCSLLFTATKC